MGRDPWGADSLEWATASPPAPYNFVEIPYVTSRYPLWDQPSHDWGGEETPEHARPVLVPPAGEEEHYTMATGGVDAAPEQVMPMPSPTAWPLLLTIAMTVTFLGVLIRQLWVAGVGGLLATLVLIAWFWPDWDDEHVELRDVDELEEALR